MVNLDTPKLALQVQLKTVLVLISVDRRTTVSKTGQVLRIQNPSKSSCPPSFVGNSPG